MLSTQGQNDNAAFCHTYLVWLFYGRSTELMEHGGDGFLQVNASFMGFIRDYLSNPYRLL